MPFGWLLYFVVALNDRKTENVVVEKPFWPFETRASSPDNFRHCGDLAKPISQCNNGPHRIHPYHTQYIDAHNTHTPIYIYTWREDAHPSPYPCCWPLRLTHHINTFTSRHSSDLPNTQIYRTPPYTVVVISIHSCIFSRVALG